MSHPHENFNVQNLEIGVGQYPPQSAQNRASHGVSDFADGSGHIFSMYLEMATEEDKKMVENWKADADGILIFTGLFSAAVATLISVSIQDLQQNPQDTSNFYLANIYQATISPNSPSISTSPPSSPPPFSPPNHAVWVNALWFMSLVISLTCALLATLLQQWARRFLRITQSRYSPHKRARIRAFFSEGVAKCLLPWTVDALPTLLHISLFLFFAGLVVFLCNINLTIFKFVLSWVGLCMALYGCITCMPIFRHDSPYYTPLSLPVWHIVTGIPFLVYWFLRWFNDSGYRHNAFRHFQRLEESCRKSLVQGMQKTAEETALNSPPEIDTRAFMWTFNCLDEDHELEHFFSGLPGFRSSNFVQDPLRSLTEEEKSKLYDGLRGLLDRTFSSDFLPAPVKNRRALICAKVVDPEHARNTFIILDTILREYQHSGPVAIGIVNVFRGWGNSMHEYKVVYARLTISQIIATSQPHDDSWYNFTSNELGLPETSLRDYAAHGDSLSLAILIYLVRQQFIHFWKLHWPRDSFSLVLATASKFNVKDTLPNLEHEFCALWNQIVHEAQDCNDRHMAFLILRPIRDVFLALHQDTDSAPTQFSASTDDRDRILLDPSSYPVCRVPDHRSDSTPPIHDDGVSTTLTHAIPHDPNVPAFVPPLASPDPPSSSANALLPVDETLTGALPLDNQVQSSIKPICQTTTESRCIPTDFLSPATACTMHLSTSEHSTSGPPPRSSASASPPEDVTELSRAPPDDLDVRSSPSPVTPILDAIPPTDSHSSTLASAAEREGSMEEDASYSHSVIREDITAPTDIPPQLPSPLPVADVVIDGPSMRSLGPEHIEHRPPDAIVVEHTAVGRTLSSDVEVPSLPSPPPINMLLPLDSAVAPSEPASRSLESHSQMLAPRR